MAAEVVECASCGAQVALAEAAADSDRAPAELLQQGPGMVRFYCPDCWSDGASG